MYSFKKFLLYRKYRKKVKKRRTINFKLSKPKEFMVRLEAAGLDYVVLRWPEEVARIMQGERFSGCDIDILIDVASWKPVFELAYDLLGGNNAVKIDIYSVRPVKGFQYKRYPYYPAHIAWALLESRRMDLEGFYRPSGLPYINALAYHLAYHKGELSGLPFDEGEERFQSKRDYSQLLRDEAERENVDLPESLSVMSLHRWLEGKSCSIPYDLLMHLPLVEGSFLSRLKVEMERDFSNDFEGRYLYVFMVRDSVTEKEIEDEIISFIKKNFSILDIVNLSGEAQVKYKNCVRGGNWYEKSLGRDALPYLLVLAEDLSPKPLLEPDKAYPQIDNSSFYKKLDLRVNIEKLFDISYNPIHGTDNIKEAMYILNLLKNTDLIDQI